MGDVTELKIESLNHASVESMNLETKVGTKICLNVIYILKTR